MVSLGALVLLLAAGSTAHAKDQPLQLLFCLSSAAVRQDVYVTDWGLSRHGDGSATEVVVSGGLARAVHASGLLSFTVGALRTFHDADRELEFERSGMGLSVGYDHRIWKKLRLGLRYECGLQSLHGRGVWSETLGDGSYRHTFLYRLDETRSEMVSTYVPRLAYLSPLTVKLDGPMLLLAIEVRVMDRDPRVNGFDAVGHSPDSEAKPERHVSFERRVAMLALSVGVAL